MFGMVLKKAERGGRITFAFEGNCIANTLMSVNLFTEIFVI